MLTMPPQLHALQPASSAAYLRAAALVLPCTDRGLLELCTEQLRAAQQRSVFKPPADCTAYARAACRLADQFAVSVDGISEPQIAELVAEAGSEAVNALVNALYLIDMALRLEAVAPVVLAGAGGSAPADSGAVAPGDGEATIAQAIADFAAAAVLADGVDSITSELVRLRCAQIHHCRLCGSLRQRSALDAGFDEDMATRVARYEEGGFSAAAVAALKLADTLIMFPADADASLRDELEEHFAPAQIAEICFDVVKWSQQKALVATHIDAPPWEGVHVLDFDGEGHPVFAGPVSA